MTGAPNVGLQIVFPINNWLRIDSVTSNARIFLKRIFYLVAFDEGRTDLKHCDRRQALRFLISLWAVYFDSQGLCFTEFSGSL